MALPPSLTHLIDCRAGIRPWSVTQYLESIFELSQRCTERTVPLGHTVSFQTGSAFAGAFLKLEVALLLLLNEAEKCPRQLAWGLERLDDHVSHVQLKVPLQLPELQT